MTEVFWGGSEGRTPIGDETIIISSWDPHGGGEAMVVGLGVRQPWQICGFAAS